MHYRAGAKLIPIVGPRQQLSSFVTFPLTYFKFLTVGPIQHPHDGTAAKLPWCAIFADIFYP